MKKSIHPEYHNNATVVCSSCGSKLVTGSTVAEMRIEVCSNCHPFYTGKQNLVDTAGRVDRYRRIVSRGDRTRASRVKKSTTTKKPASET